MARTCKLVVLTRKRLINGALQVGIFLEQCCEIDRGLSPYARNATYARMTIPIRRNSDASPSFGRGISQHGPSRYGG